MREATRYARRVAVRYATRYAMRETRRDARLPIRHLHAHLSLAVVTHEEEPSVERDRAHLGRSWGDRGEVARRWWGDGRELV